MLGGASFTSTVALWWAASCWPSVSSPQYSSACVPRGRTIDAIPGSPRAGRTCSAPLSMRTRRASAATVGSKSGVTVTSNAPLGLQAATAPEVGGATTSAFTSSAYFWWAPAVGAPKSTGGGANILMLSSSTATAASVPPSVSRPRKSPARTGSRVGNVKVPGVVGAGTPALVPAPVNSSPGASVNASPATGASTRRAIIWGAEPAIVWMRQRTIVPVAGALNHARCSGDTVVDTVQGAPHGG